MTPWTIAKKYPIFLSIHQKETLYFVRLKLKLLLNQLDFVFYAQLAGQLREIVFRVSTRIEVLRTLWDECLQTVKQPDIKARINGVKTQMEKFNFFFGIQLAERILKHTNNLSRTLQNGAYSAAEGQIVAELSVRTLQSMRDDNSFDLFCAAVLSKSQRLQIAPPQLPRQEGSG